MHALPERENSRSELSKAYAIVYNDGARATEAKSIVFSNP